MTLQFSHKHNKLNYQLLYILSIVQRQKLFVCFCFSVQEQKQICKSSCVFWAFLRQGKKPILIGNVCRYSVSNDLLFLGWSI